MSLSEETAGLDEVAEALGIGPEALMRSWLRRHQRDGFPRRIPGTWTWPRRAVVAWLRSGGLVEEPVPLPSNDNDARDPIAAATRALEERYVR